MIFEFACHDHMPVLPFRCGASADAAAEFARTGFFRWHIGQKDVSSSDVPQYSTAGKIWKQKTFVKFFVILCFFT